MHWIVEAQMRIKNESYNFFKIFQIKQLPGSCTVFIVSRDDAIGIISTIGTVDLSRTVDMVLSAVFDK